MDNGQRTEHNFERAFERIAATEQAVSRMETELAAFADNTAKQFEDFVRQVGSANSEWNQRLREIQSDARAEAARIEKANKVPWLAILGFALTACALAAGLVRYSLEARTRTLEVQQEAIEEKILLVKTAQEREIALIRQLTDQRLADLKDHVNKLENKK
jgi:4-hydroxy-3-methylbut-2-enyl diphosphate reductase IspH